MCEAGDVLGWRVDGDPVLPYDSMDDGLTRISRSPILKPDLGRTEPFPFSVARTYSIQVSSCHTTHVMDVICRFEHVFCFSPAALVVPAGQQLHPVNRADSGGLMAGQGNLNGANL